MGLVVLLLVWLQWRSGIDFYLAFVPAGAALAYVALASGRLLLAAAGARAAGPCAAWTVGLLASCLAIYAVTALLPLTAPSAFAALAALVVMIELSLAGRLPWPSADVRALAGFALCVAFTAAWCSAPAGAYEVLRTQDVLPVWHDYFFHGGIISQFGDARAAGHQSIYLSDFPSSFYHFGSYAGAAALAGMVDQPGLALAMAVWLPLGFLAMATGAYTLGERLAGAAGGIAALAAVAMLPDASNYGLRNGLFSFHWMVLAHPGAAYALAAAFMSLGFLDRWRTEGSGAALAASALLALSTILFRAHVSVLYVPAWLAAALFCAAADTRRKLLVAILLLLGLLAGAVGGSLLLAHVADSDPSYWRFGGPQFEKLLGVLHTEQEPTAYTGLYAGLISDASSASAVAAGIVLTVVAALGAFVLLLPAAMALARRFGALRPIDAFPAYLAFCWLLLIPLAPVPWHGDPSNLVVQPSVLLYSCVAIWTLCLPLRIAAARHGQCSGRLVFAMLGTALAALPAIAAGGATLAHPKFGWGQKGAAQRVEPGLVEAAAFMRRQAAVGDIFATAGLTDRPGGVSDSYAVFDRPTILCALSGIPAYLARPYMEMIKDARRKSVAAARLTALENVELTTDYAAAMQSLRRLGVQWYVVGGEPGPRWDPKRERAAFRAGTIAVYLARTGASGGAFHDEMRIRYADQVVAHEALNLAERAPGERLIGTALSHVTTAVKRQEQPSGGALILGEAAVERDEAASRLERLPGNAQQPAGALIVEVMQQAVRDHDVATPRGDRRRLVHRTTVEFTAIPEAAARPLDVALADVVADIADGR